MHLKAILAEEGVQNIREKFAFEDFEKNGICKIFEKKNRTNDLMQLTIVKEC